MNRDLTDKVIVSLDKDFDSFKCGITCLVTYAKRYIALMSNESQTRISLIDPMLRVMGYDLCNPMEVRVEYVKRVSSTSLIKVDYAIFVEDLPYLMIEAKKCSCQLDENNINQLGAYFNNIKPVLGVLTNGTTYKFFCSKLDYLTVCECLGLQCAFNSDEDIDFLSNNMSDKPFFTFDLLSLTDSSVNTLFMLSKSKISSSLLKLSTVYKFRGDLINLLISQANSTDNTLLSCIKSLIPVKNLPDESIAIELQSVFKALKFDIENTSRAYNLKNMCSNSNHLSQLTDDEYVDEEEYIDEDDATL